MSFSLPCPHCQSVVELPDSEAGKVTGCPECGQAFETPPLARPLDDDAPPPRPQRSVGLGIPMSAWKALSDHTPLEDEPRRPPAPFGVSLGSQPDWASAPAALASHPPLEPGWKRVASGLRFLGGLSLLYLVGNFFAACFALVGEPEAGTFSLLYSAVGIIMLLLGLLGLWDCCAMPPQSGVRGLTLTTAWMIVAGAGLLGLGLLLTVLANATPRRGYRGGDDMFIAMISALVLVLAALALAAALIMFLFVLRGIALFFQDQRLAQNIIAYFFVILCTPVAVVIMLMCLGVLLVDSRSGRGALPLLLWAVSLVIVTGLTLWFFNLLRDTRSRIVMALQGTAVSDGP